jgi:hypothetical protein
MMDPEKLYPWLFTSEVDADLRQERVHNSRAEAQQLPSGCILYTLPGAVVVTKPTSRGPRLTTC